MTKTTSLTTLSIESSDALKFDKIAKANGISKKELFTQMISYFERNGINPLTHSSPAGEITKLTKRVDQVVAFIRKQEQDILRPLAISVSTTEERIKQALELLATVEHLKKLRELQKNSDEKIERKLSEINMAQNKLNTSNNQALRAIAEHLDKRGNEGLLNKIFG